MSDHYIPHIQELALFSYHVAFGDLCQVPFLNESSHQPLIHVYIIKIWGNVKIKSCLFMILHFKNTDYILIFM